MKLILLVIGIVLLCGNVYANIGYTEINLIDYKTNIFIHANSSILLTDYTFELKTGGNWIGMPFNTTIDDADGLIKDIQPHCITVSRWNSASQEMESYGKLPSPPFPPGLYAGTNFEVKATCGYKVKVTTNTTWTIECLQPTAPIIQYKIIDLNNYIGTNIIRVRNI